MSEEEQKHLQQSYYDLHEKYYKQKEEIERLNENNQAMQEEMARTWKKLEEKENIIKEVREYIDDVQYHH